MPSIPAMTDNTEHETEVVEYDDPKGIFNTGDRLELIATITLAVATILTAWSAFQAGKWGGTQSINFSEAGAARTTAARSLPGARGDSRPGHVARARTGCGR